MRVNELDPLERASLLVRTDGELEPAMLWLNEDGTPRPKTAWYKAFAGANARVRKAGIERLDCQPHMLRHSFALRWYAVGRIVWSKQLQGLDAHYQADFRDQFGDTWSLVQTMLGHADVATTRKVYLEPFQTLDARLLLEHGKSALDVESLIAVLSSNPRVRVMPEGFGEI